MAKSFMGVRLRSLREERGITQAALAQALKLSPSYFSQMESNQRPMTVQVLLRLQAYFGIDLQLLSEDEESRAVAELREITAGVTKGRAASWIRTMSGRWLASASRPACTDAWRVAPPLVGG